MWPDPKFYTIMIKTVSQLKNSLCFCDKITDTRIFLVYTPIINNKEERDYVRHHDYKREFHK